MPITISRRLLLPPALFGLAALTAPVGASAADPSRLASGEIDVKAFAVKGSDTPKVVMTAVVEAPPEKVWQVVSDCSRYKGRLPRVASAKLLEKSGKKHRCEVTIEMPFPLSNLTAVTEAIHEEDDRLLARRWRLVRGDYKFNFGSWEVRPFDDKRTKSLVTYTVHAEPNVPVPAFIRDKAQKTALPELMQRVRAEAKKIK
jgi:ribosome-associated toxin RatA of RatAB toxin-antitoxin module